MQRIHDIGLFVCSVILLQMYEVLDIFGPSHVGQFNYIHFFWKGLSIRTYKKVYMYILEFDLKFNFKLYLLLVG